MLGKPEVQYGDTISAAVPPDWKIVRRMAAELLDRSRDLRLAVHLLRASLALYGIDGLADGMRLIERLLDERWDSVHPQLDADDDMDPMLRINSLAILADRATVLGAEGATLVLLPGLGPLSLRMLEIANGELAPAERRRTRSRWRRSNWRWPTSIAASLGAAVDALQRAFDSVRNIEMLLVRQVGSSQALNLDALTRALKRGPNSSRSQLAPARAPPRRPQLPTAGRRAAERRRADRARADQRRDRRPRRRAAHARQADRVLPRSRTIEPGAAAAGTGQAAGAQELFRNHGGPRAGWHRAAEGDQRAGWREAGMRSTRGSTGHRCFQFMEVAIVGKESSQKFIARNRAPRVQIEYDVEVYGAEKKIQLPFVMGVMADLSGQPADPLAPVAERKFLEIDVDNFDERLKAMKPRVAVQVPNTLTGEGNLSVEMTFESMDDFTPAAIARKVGSLNKLLEARSQLSNLMTYMDGKTGAEDLIAKLLAEPALMQALTSAPKPQE